MKKRFLMGIFVSTDAFIEEGNSTEIRNFEEQMGLKEAPTLGIPIEDFLIKNSSSIQTLVNEFEQKLKDLSNGTLSYETVSPWVKEYAERLWTNAMEYVQGGANDDRPLYWARIKMEVALKNHFKSQMNGTSVIENTELSRLIQLFEEKSRNYTGIDFTDIPESKKKILITGFDPFDLDYKPEQNNPSGIVALALHGKTIKDEYGNEGFIQTTIFPVRYQDFDNEVVEKVVTPLLQNNVVNYIISLSLNGSAFYFDLERFAVKKRGGFMDNMNIGSIKYLKYTNVNYKLFKSDIGKGNNYYETTLPINKIVTKSIANNFLSIGQRVFFDQSYGIDDENFIVEHPIVRAIDNTVYNTNEKSFGESDIQVENMMVGSGGDYLSNEIFYRISRARENTNTTVQTGHYHVANPSGELPSGILIRHPDLGRLINSSTYQRFTQAEILQEIERVIKQIIK